MPNLSIKDVPEPLADALRRRAAMNHRSLQGELLSIIEQAVAGQAMPHALPAASPARKPIEQIAAEMRAAGVRPVAGQPLAVDILRADRDAR